MLEDIIIIKFKLTDKISANLIKIAGLLIYYKQVTFSAYSYTSLLCLIHITKSSYYSAKNLKDTVNYKNN